MQSALQNLPVGWRFQPTNEELLDHYLKNKRLGLPIYGSDIQDIQICDFDPWDLIDRNSPYKERYLFCRRQFHHKTGGIQRKRKAKAGYWKRTGEIQSITREDVDEVIGTKTIFVYHNPKPTEFVKHEFEVSSPAQDNYDFVQNDDDFVVCKLMIIKKKKASNKLKKVGLLSEKKGAIEVDCSKIKPNKRRRKGLADCDTAPVSVSNDPMQEEILNHLPYGEDEPSNHITTDFNYQNRSYGRAYSACGEDKPINHLTLDSENQTPSMMTATSTGEGGESSYRGDCDLECRKEYEMNNTLFYDKDSTMFLVDSDLGNQNPQEISDVSRYSISVTSSQMTANLENQIPNDIDAISLHEISSSWSGNQNLGETTAVSTPRTVETSSLTNFDFENSNQNEMISDLCCKEGERSWPVALDFGNQIPSKETNISASLERGLSLLQETPLDFGKQNQYEKTDMSDTQYFRSSLLDSCVLESDFEATFPEITLEMLEELKGLLNTPYSEPMVDTSTSA